MNTQDYSLKFQQAETRKYKTYQLSFFFKVIYTRLEFYSIQVAEAQKACLYVLYIQQ